jgi:glycerol-3-phosphate dehydrogenase
VTPVTVISLDVLIFGGGVAGLWLLDDLRRAGYRVLLLESDALGAGQTIASQGIIHGGLKYTLSGLFNPAADAIRDMPQLWRDCLAGRREPDLRGTRVRAEHCHLWRTGDLRSIAGIIGARVGLRVAPSRLDRPDWPAALRGCPGDVFRLDEQVIDPASLISDLAARNREHVLKYDASSLTAERQSGPAGNQAPVVRIAAGSGGASGTVALTATTVVLCAGRGNAALRTRFGLRAEMQQVRLLHMVMMRGPLPVLNGHCTDGGRTRVTITTARDAPDNTVWQVGGQLAEDGVEHDRAELIARARRELHATLPAVNMDHVEWSTYRSERAEAATGGRRPVNATVLADGAIITAWPTKLALAPQLAADVRKLLSPPLNQLPAAGWSVARVLELAAWPRPDTARPPWDTEDQWSTASWAAAGSA